MKRVLIIYRDRPRSPLATDFYHYLQRYNDIDLEITLFCDPTGNALDFYKYYCKHEFDGIMEGLGTNMMLQIQEPFPDGVLMLKHMGDHFCFMRDFHNVVEQYGVPPHYHYIIGIGTPEMPWTHEFDGYVYNNFKITNTRYFPWGINIDKYIKFNPRMRKYHYEIMMSMSKGQQGIWRELHDKRHLIQTALEGMTPRPRMFTSQVWGDEYYKALWESISFVVDGAGRGYLTQKYLEGAVAGCFLMGDAPPGVEEVFNEDTMAIIGDDTPGADIVDAVQRYCRDDIGRRDAMAEECRRRVLEHFNMKTVSDQFINWLKEELR